MSVVRDGLPALPISTFTHGALAAAPVENQKVVVAALLMSGPLEGYTMLHEVLSGAPPATISCVLQVTVPAVAPSPVSPVEVRLEVANALPSLSPVETSAYLKSQ